MAKKKSKNVVQYKIHGVTLPEKDHQPRQATKVHAKPRKMWVPQVSQSAVCLVAIFLFIAVPAHG